MDSQIVRKIYRPEGTNRYFDAGSMSYGLSYAKYFTDRFSAGFTAHFLHMGLAERSVESFAFDFGLLYRIGIRGMTLGMMVQSLGSDKRHISQQNNNSVNVSGIGTVLSPVCYLIQAGLE